MRCLPNGTLRAFLDRELPPEVMADAAMHLAGCSGCSGRLDVLSARALRVSALLDFPQSNIPDCRWTGPKAALSTSRSLVWVPAALAAAAAVAILVWSGGDERAGQPAPTASVPAPQALQVPAPALAQADKPLPPHASAMRPSPARPRPVATVQAEPSLVKREIPYFLRLDDEPFEYGPVVRVGLGPAGIPADVVFSPDGRPRAIRLASFVLEGEEQ